MQRNKLTYRTWVFLVLGLFYLTTHIYIATRPLEVLMSWFLIDDAFYYFQVARNVIRGIGFSFDGIALTNGFHPLWMVINIFLFLLSNGDRVIALRLHVILGAVLTFSGGIFLYLMLKRRLRKSVALLAFFFWIFFWPIQRFLTMGGLETGLNAAMILCFLFLSQRLCLKNERNLILLGFFGSLVLFSRLDNIFLVLLMGIWIVFADHFIRYYLISDVFGIFISVFTAVILRVGTFEALAFLPATTILLLLAIPTRLSFIYLFGLYSPQPIKKKTLFLRILIVVASSSIVNLLAMLLLTHFNLLPSGFPRAALLIEPILALFFVGVIRLFPLSFSSRKSLSEEKNELHFGRIFYRSFLFLFPVMILFGGYIIWNMRYFGTPMPVSGQIKQWWGTLPNPPYAVYRSSVLEMFGLVPQISNRHPWFLLYEGLLRPITGFLVPKLAQAPLLLGAVNGILVALMIAAGYFIFIRRQVSGFLKKVQHLCVYPTFIAGLLQPFYLFVAGYAHSRIWYWVSQAIVTIIVGSVLLDLGLRKLESRLSDRRVGLGIVAFLALLLGSWHVVKVRENFPPEASMEMRETFLLQIRFLESNTEVGSLIGMTGGGVEAYFIVDRVIVNLDGLMNSADYFAALQTGEAEIYLDSIGLDYVFGQEQMLLNSDPYWWFFANRLTPCDSLLNLTLYCYASE